MKAKKARYFQAKIKTRDQRFVSQQLKKMVKNDEADSLVDAAGILIIEALEAEGRNE